MRQAQIATILGVCRVCIDKSLLNAQRFLVALRGPQRIGLGVEDTEVVQSRGKVAQRRLIMGLIFDDLSLKADRLFERCFGLLRVSMLLLQQRQMIAGQCELCPVLMKVLLSLCERRLVARF